MELSSYVFKIVLLWLLFQMREWGVFVAIDHSRLSCLLHISNISQVNVRAIEVGRKDLQSEFVMGCIVYCFYDLHRVPHLTLKIVKIIA